MDEKADILGGLLVGLGLCDVKSFVVEVDVAGDCGAGLE